MRAKYDYEEVLQLKHSEIPAAVDQESGEVRVVTPKKKRTVSKNQVKFQPEGLFTRHYNQAWEFLYYRLSPLEFRVTSYLAMKARPFTNSLDPLSDETTLQVLATTVGISIGKTKVVFEKLFQMGVYGKFEVVEAGKGHTKYWVLNPYLSFNGSTIDKGIASLFINTEIAKATDPSLR